MPHLFLNSVSRSGLTTKNPKINKQKPGLTIKVFDGSTAGKGKSHSTVHQRATPAVDKPQNWPKKKKRGANRNPRKID